ncbi:MAG: D-alanyl-D-alanine carboxypeptidase [Oscillospiraceae bacterium]|nr:D-alanyl-D-alanine carboxypeptidase [Oscillospiraceae bacterium]
MKRFAAVFLSVSVLLFALPISSSASVSVSAIAAVLIDADTKAVLYSKNQDKRLAMASTTKIMTALLALENDKKGESFTVDSKAINVEGSSMGLQDGDKVTLKTLTVGMLMLSGNDAANAAAVFMAGSNASFAKKMNERAAEIGMKNTNFVTPSGLDEENHYSTAYDMALLGAEAIKNAEFLEICSKSKYTVEFGAQPSRRTLYNHNRLVKEVEGCIGIKTGFTKKAGRCLVSAVRRGGRTLVCVTLKAPSDWSDHKALYNYGFSLYNESEIKAEPIKLEIVNSEKDLVAALPKETPKIMSRQGEKISVKTKIRPFEYAPVYSGQIVGSLCVEVDGAEIYETELILSESAHAKNEKLSEKPLNPFERLIEWFKSLFK